MISTAFRKSLEAVRILECATVFSGKRKRGGGLDGELQRVPRIVSTHRGGRNLPVSQVGYYAWRVVMKVHKLTHGIMYKKSTPYMTIKDQGTQTSKWVNGTYRLERFVF